MWLSALSLKAGCGHASGYVMSDNRMLTAQGTCTEQWVECDECACILFWGIPQLVWVCSHCVLRHTLTCGRDSVLRQARSVSVAVCAVYHVNFPGMHQDLTRIRWGTFFQALYHLCLSKFICYDKSTYMHIKTMDVWCLKTGCWLPKAHELCNEWFVMSEHAFHVLEHKTIWSKAQTELGQVLFELVRLDILINDA